MMKRTRRILLAVPLLAALSLPVAAMAAEPSELVSLSNNQPYLTSFERVETDPEVWDSGPAESVSALLQTAAEAADYVELNPVSPELKELIRGTNFADESLLVYFSSCYSGGDTRPTHTSDLAEGTLKIRIFDENPASERKAISFRAIYLVTVRCRKENVTKIDVQDTLARCKGRVYHLRSESTDPKDLAHQLVRSFAAYAAFTDAEIDTMTALDFRHSNLSAKDIERLAPLPRLEHLTLGIKNARPEIVAALHKLKSLKALDISDAFSASRPIGTACIAALPSTLKSLDVSGTMVDDEEAMLMIGKFKGLESLSARHLTRIVNSLSNEVVGPGVSLSTFEKLIEALPNLKYLDVRENAHTEAFFKTISESKLETLRVRAGGTHKFVAQSLLHLSSMNSLKRLDFHSDSLSDDHLPQLAALKNLVHLDISGFAKITDQGIAHLRDLPRLESLSLGYSEAVTDAGIRELYDLPLKRLDLRCTKVTAEGLKHLAQEFPMLEELNLRYTGMGEAGLDAIAAFRNLKRLNYARAFDRFGRSEPISKRYPHLQLYSEDISFME